MRQISDILWGIVFVVVAILLALHFTHVITLQPFAGWWTLFIIVPSAIALTNKESRKRGFVGLLIGIVLLLSSNHFFDIEMARNILIVIILLAIGLSLIFKRQKRAKRAQVNSDGAVSLNAVFSGHELKYGEGQEFKGCDCKAIFGGLDIDLSQAKFRDDREINVTAAFGGADIRVPSDVNVILDSTGIFGGVQDRTDNGSDNQFTLYVNVVAAFGGVDIK